MCLKNTGCYTERQREEVDKTKTGPARDVLTLEMNKNIKDALNP